MTEERLEEKPMRSIQDLQGKSYMTCSACMSVWADGLSWANAHPERITKNPSEADNLIVLSCQVTDLAVLSDLKVLDRLKLEFPDKNIFASGCLAKRPDVEIPSFVERLETPRENYQFLFDRTLVNFEKPFWVKDFKEQDNDKKNGHLFRNMYPLRIGKGCPNKCTYCTIRITRGEFEKLDSSRLEKEFQAFDNVLLIGDSPLVSQLEEWYEIAKRNKKPFSIRNVEPSVTVACERELLDLADSGLLKVYHSPIQSSTPEVLQDMYRSVTAAQKTMQIARRLKEKGVYIATNIIIDYKDFKQDFAPVYALYDYVSWNPLWNGKWDRRLAEQRFVKYLESCQEPLEVRQAMARAGVVKNGV